MSVIAFIHQKGGTGKSTLAIACSMALAQAGHRVLLLDADYQGTASEWAIRFGQRFNVESRSQIQPVVHKEIGRFMDKFEYIVIDAPPSLSEMTASVLRACDTAVIPMRPSFPDVWALPWLAAIITKLRNEGHTLSAKVIFNQYQGEDLARLKEELEPWKIPVHPEQLPMDAAFSAVFEGKPLPGPLAEAVLSLLEKDSGD